MGSSRFDRRYVERYAELTDTVAVGPRSHRMSPYDRDVMPLVELSRRLKRMPAAPDPTPEFRDQLRTFLVANAERGVGASGDETTAWISTRPALAGSTQAIRQVPGAPGRRTRRARVAILVGITGGAVALSGVSAASSDSLPGEPLYQLKRSTEQAQLALAGSDLSRGLLYLKFARSRLGEARLVTANVVAEVLADMDAETQRGVSLLGAAAVQSRDGGALDAIRAFVAQQRERVDALRASLPPTLVGTTKPSLTLLDRIETRITDLAAALDRGCDIAAVDELGPDPAGC